MSLTEEKRDKLNKFAKNASIIYVVAGLAIIAIGTIILIKTNKK